MTKHCASKHPGYSVMSHQSKGEELFELCLAKKAGKVDTVDVI